MIQFKGEFLWPFFVPMFIFLALTLGFTIRNLKLILYSSHATGRVVGFESVEGADGKVTQAQRVEFKTPDEKIHEALAKVRSSPPSGQVGDRVKIYYSPQQPEEAKVGSFMELWLHVTVFLVLFSIFFIIWFGTWVGPPDQVAKHAPKGPSMPAQRP